MKIKYAFLDGTVTEVEVSDEIGAVIIDSRKAEHAQDERHRYHCYSYDAIDYEGEEYGACDEYAVEDDSAEQTARIREAFSHLTATQQRRLRLYANGKTPAGNRCHRRGQLFSLFPSPSRRAEKKVFEIFPPDTLTNPRFFLGTPEGNKIQALRKGR